MPFPGGDFYGNDLMSYKVISADLCATVCYETAACLAFTYNTYNGSKQS